VPRWIVSPYESYNGRQTRRILVADDRKILCGGARIGGTLASRSSVPSVERNERSDVKECVR
jgi:phosphatidylserine/phosphatidylglycerophosphate/cardiolipin synthase-like enzyme